VLYLVFLAFAVMRWLILALIVSLVALLLAAAGMVRHVWLQRHRHNAAEPAAPIAPHNEIDPEL
jgi:hypothetical protein